MNVYNCDIMIGVIPSSVDTKANIFPMSSIGTHTEINPLESDKEYIPNVSMIVPSYNYKTAQ